MDCASGDASLAPTRGAGLSRCPRPEAAADLRTHLAPTADWQAADPNSADLEYHDAPLLQRLLNGREVLKQEL